jgi:hypothetical protein
MNQGVGGKILIQQTACKISHDTVPLTAFVQTAHCTADTVHRATLLAGFLEGPPSRPDLFLHTITLSALSCDAPLTLSNTTLELAARGLLLSKKRSTCGGIILGSPPQSTQSAGPVRFLIICSIKPGSRDDKSTLDVISREGKGCVPG